MTNIKYTVKFFLNKNFEKSGKQKLYGRILFKRKKSEFATNLWLEMDKWNHELQVAIKSPIIDRQLSNIKSEINQTVQHLYYEKKHIDAKSIKDYYLGNEVLDIGIVEYIDRIVKQKQKQKSLSETTPMKYMQIGKKVSKFISEKYRVTDLDIKRIDYEFVIQFDTYLRSIITKQYNKPFKNSTMNKTHGFFRTVLNQAFDEDYIRKNPYKRFRLKKVESKIKYLTNDELSRIEQLDLSLDYKLDMARDIFLFSVFTGLRFGDVISLTTDNLIYENGVIKSFYKEYQQKTQTYIENPFFPKVISIIEKYSDTAERLIQNMLLPKMSNTNVNKRLKQIGKLAGLHFELHHHVARHTCATTVLLENGVTLEEVKEWLGHVDIRSTMVYAKVTSTQKRKTLERLVA